MEITEGTLKRRQSTRKKRPLLRHSFPRTIDSTRHTAAPAPSRCPQDPQQVAAEAIHHMRHESLHIERAHSWKQVMIHCPLLWEKVLLLLLLLMLLRLRFEVTAVTT